MSVLPLGLGWSLWIHLFVQYPKCVGTVLLGAALSSIPVEAIGLGAGRHSVARSMLCATVPTVTGALCPDPHASGGSRRGALPEPSATRQP